MDVLDLHRVSVELNSELLAELSPDDLALDTPCAGWTVRDLLEHMVYTARMMDAGARDAPFRAVADENDLVASYRIANGQFTATFEADGTLDREMEIKGYGGKHRGLDLVAVHYVDNLVHWWDLKSALGQDATLDPDLARAAYRIVSRYPTTPEFRGPQGAFAQPVDVPDDAPLTDRVIALTGRAPDWRR